MNEKGSEENIKFNAVFSLIIGIISIFGLIFVKEGTFLSIAGLIWGLMSLKESNVKQRGRKLALVAIAFNFIGFIGVITLTV
ncbi:thiamine transporter ThiT [Metabacillus crassostreae]|uniref:DUF4190 domain-containing protein n=1 Tax=Metabacillus crassostreae TaxID=929098 RepID=UPI001956729A|nr:DUF4190 domain-containing protein [Metabacillus crassostreae]MBM7602569.1 thiamine transporter ThiT [Metabacillus crassostreae]